ncbi:4-hydroxythreonine-4-phosphate dehydrogenase [Rubripirellula obstinata]|uniref:4-hydroxythreonine-4-phosphate dehydrogenase n=1 Tax=Rubripirellula obstinata TaxID=406547 RepID=A0A5B1CNT6_9BACT|nr:4-hydroxythreonine-4-phosphate dehydrogenase PdxA [Rubripirellula obstinata]KAA1262032.1 4-hydroxythreonine-4-phosphate dehydrogenase [Rubripirellula obstinata]
MQNKLPTIAISVGDVSGVGPELAIKCAAVSSVISRCQPVLYGPQDCLNQIAERLGIPIAGNVKDVGHVNRVIPGSFSAETGQASFDAFDAAVADAISGTVSAVVTGPIQKEAWHLAGIPFPGHTEVLADRTGTNDFCMMLTSKEMSCVLATIHIPLADVPSQLSQAKIQRAIRLADQAMSRRLVSQGKSRSAKIVVCGLNPHAGENGLFSHGEEAKVIVPAIEKCVEAGIDVTGPVPPDTAFTPSMRKTTDAYVCMYHDQGLIPIKALSFDDAVNVTLGLPIVRTSVDHGTALDLAWQGTANHQSMLAAIEMAIDLAAVRAD